MQKSHSRFVNQKSIARELGVTDRRVRQLVAEFIVPEPRHTDGLYDLELCQDRFELYRNGTDHDWERFGDEMLAGTKETAELVECAYDEGATVDDVQNASQAVHADVARFRFYNACRSRSKSDADVWHLIAEEELKRTIGGLLHRGIEVMGASGIVDDDGKIIFAMPIYPDLDALNAGRR